jgi:phosphoribosylformylglycinamidine cyclo-ligase
MPDPYRQAGVDLEAAALAVSRIRDLAAGASRPEAVEGVGGFAGLFDLGDGRLLAAAADGVGTKVEIARTLGRLDTVGIDLVAMSANDVVCTGAEPLFFLDYVATGRLVADEVEAIVAGVAEGCRRAGCALLGGETAEHPGVMEPGRFDLAGFCVGIVPGDELVGPHRVDRGDALIGLPSSGLHANGFSLVRRVVGERGLSLEDDPLGSGRPLGEVLLEPTSIYVEPVLALRRAGLLRSAAHVTGGGIVDNLPRALPGGLGASLDRNAWIVPPVLEFFRRAADIPEVGLLRTFNMGLGMILVVPSDAVDRSIDTIREAGVAGTLVGRVVDGPGLRW